MTTSYNKKRPHTTVGDGHCLLVVGSCYEGAYKSSRCARIAVIEARNECNRLEFEAVAKLYGEGFDEFSRIGIHRHSISCNLRRSFFVRRRGFQRLSRCRYHLHIYNILFPYQKLGVAHEEVNVDTYIGFLDACSCSSCISQRLRRQPTQLQVPLPRLPW